MKNTCLSDFANCGSEMVHIKNSYKRIPCPETCTAWK